MDGIDFDELNKIGEDWERKVVAASAEEPEAAEEQEAAEDDNGPQDDPQDVDTSQHANAAATGEA